MILTHAMAINANRMEGAIDGSIQQIADAANKEHGMITSHGAFSLMITEEMILLPDEDDPRSLFRIPDLLLIMLFGGALLWQG